MNGNGGYALKKQEEARRMAQDSLRKQGGGVSSKPYSYFSNTASSGKPVFGREFKVEKTEVDYTVGDKVRHIKYGTGTVTSLVAGGKDYEVTVDFERVGVKRMFASFAKLKKVDG